jgi:hypothetical protein
MCLSTIRLFVLPRDLAEKQTCLKRKAKAAWRSATDLAATGNCLERISLKNVACNLIDLVLLISFATVRPETGKVISSRSFQPRGRYGAPVPTTVVNAQVESYEFPDPYFDMNLQISEYDLPIGLNTFNHLPMDKDSPYVVRGGTAFQVPAL